MALHARRQIRDEAERILKGLPTTQDRVFTGRTRVLTAAQMPALLIYAIEEVSDLHAKGDPAKLMRTLTLAVEGRVTAAEPPDDTLDSIAREVEEVLGGTMLGDGVLSQTLTATRINTQAPGESHIGEIRMEFAVTYLTTEADPTSFV